MESSLDLRKLYCLALRSNTTLRDTQSWLGAFSTHSADAILQPDSQVHRQYTPKTLESTTMFYCSGSNTSLEPHYTAQLQSIEAFAGSQMIRALEGLLQPKALAKSSKDQLIGLSILLFGELISVGFSNAKTTAWDVRPHNIVDTETSSLISTANLRVTEKCQIVL